MSNLGQASGA